MATLKELRLKRFLSQEDLAEKSGVAAVTINRLENDKQKPTFKTIRKLAAALGVEPGQIEFPGSSESPPTQVAKLPESEDQPSGYPPTRLATSNKCPKCGERARAEFHWANPEHSDIWLAECPKCGGLLVLTRPNWAPSQPPETEQKS